MESFSRQANLQNSNLKMLSCYIENHYVINPFGQCSLFIHSEYARKVGQKWVWKIDVYPVYKGEILLTAEAALQMCFFYKIKFWKYATNLQENTHAEMWFQWSYKATLLESHFCIGVLL